MSARAIMVLGTASHVGKSLFTAALCRIASDEGYRVAPFKSQNMSLNSAVTPEGLEIGRAQALQAEAARVPPSVHMNPILLKPSGDMSSQVVVRGRIWAQVSAANYHLRRVEELMPLVRESYQTLAAAHDVILCEGAGSPAEINLKQHDIVNMRIAELADAACLLVGDIDRGGIFASLYGTVELLDPHERDRIRGFLINKFRGDVSLLTPGVRMIEGRLHKPCLGVLPWLPQLMLDEEDSVGLASATANTAACWRTLTGPTRALRIAVIGLPSLSNFTDFDCLRAEPSVSLAFCRTPEDLRHADLIILPGSKQTAADLLWMRSIGLDLALLDHARTGLIAGVCGGFQMLGQHITDPHAMEHTAAVPALGLLPIHTTMQPEKTTRLSAGRLAQHTLFGQPIASVALNGYEIHIGQTDYLANAAPFATLHPEPWALDAAPHPDGCLSPDTRIFGTYLHGLFDDDTFRHAILAAARAFHHLAPATHLNQWQHQRGAALDRLADAVRASVDLPAIFSWAGLPYTGRRPPHEARP